MSTATDRAATVRAVLGDDMMGALILLRHATEEYTRYPWRPFMGHYRVALFTALEDVMALQVNRTISMAIAPIMDIARRVSALEAREDGRQP